MRPAPQMWRNHSTSEWIECWIDIQTFKQRSVAMLGWAVTFLVIALIAAVLGFGGIAGFAVELAKIVFVVALILFVISAVVGLARGRSPTLP
jgi:uncharacterized membrane protein YtjA (UPF0391 family)